MPGRLFLTRPLADVARYLGVAGLPENGPRDDISPGEEILVVVPGRRLAAMRWGLIPQGRVNARGRPVMDALINARSETLFSKSAFTGLRRGAVPADGWFEWTGAPRKKQRWRISARDGAPLLFAAVWDVWHAPGGREVSQVATVTCAPSADVAEIHDRMGVLLSPDDLETWLAGSEAEAAPLMRPLPPGRLRVVPD